MLMRQTAVLLLSCLGMLFLVSCSSGPTPPKMGTPEWYWVAAHDQFAAGDLAKTQEHLEKVVAVDNPFKSRAATWYLVLLAGMALGQKELADAYDAGSTETKTQSSDFRRKQAEAQRLSKQYCITLAQELDRFQKEMGNATEYSLEFKVPPADSSQEAALGRIKKGFLPPDSERAKAERSTVARGVLLEATSVIGAGDDTAKAAAAFENQPVKVPRAVFLYGLAQSLVEQSKIFDRKRLNEPDKKKLLLQMASDCLKPAAEGDDADLKKKAKALAEKIAKEQKTGGKA